MSDEGEISSLVTHADSRDGFRKAMAAVLSIASWEADNIGMSTDATTLTSEVEIYLRAWKPHHNILLDQPQTGISGRSHEFSFLVDGELIDVVSSMPQATAAEVRKLADVRGIPSQTETPIRIILDDRPNLARAKQEAMILSRFADVMFLTALQDKINLAAPSH